jgi:hypothetical protein
LVVKVIAGGDDLDDSALTLGGKGYLRPGGEHLREFARAL